jgi:hypothetical protein
VSPENNIVQLSHKNDPLKLVNIHLFHRPTRMEGVSYTDCTKSVGKGGWSREVVVAANK